MSRRFHLPRRTVRIQLTLLYGVLFLLSGAGLLAATYFLVQQASAGVPGSAGAKPGQAPALIQPDAQHAEQMNQLLVQSGIALGGMSVLSVGLGWVVAGRVLRPLRTITAMAREISATNLHQRLDLNGPDDELTELGDTVDALLARLEASFQSQRRFVANASHELRTPLAWQRTLLQVSLSDPDATIQSLQTAQQKALAATYQQERLINALLTLAHGERGLDQRHPLDLADVAGQVLQTHAPRHDISVKATLDHAPTAGDAQLVERLVANLVDNALRHNVPHGQLEISTKTTASGAVLTVTNTGPVIPPGEVDRLFQPFQRLGADRTHHHEGHGLGLSIVNAIATAHHATINAHPQATGGMRVTVTFTRSDTTPSRKPGEGCWNT